MPSRRPAGVPQAPARSACAGEAQSERAYSLGPAQVKSEQAHAYSEQAHAYSEQAHWVSAASLTKMAPPVTIRSPGLSPLNILTIPLTLSPVRTERDCRRPWDSATQMRAVSPS